jgi:uncharacterized protein YraI
MRTIQTLSAALVALAVSGGIAAAASATTDLNIRSGPGPEYQVIGVIPSGAPVDVLGCTGSWCQVNYAGRAGFASGSYLSGDARAAVVVPGVRAYGPTPAYGPTYGYADRGGSVYDSYAYDDDAYDDDDDDDYGAVGYPSAESFHFSFGRPHDPGYRGGYRDW